MTSSPSDLIRTQYDNLPGLAVLEGFGQKLLAIGFIISVSVEIYRAVTRGHCNFLAPLVRVVAAGILLTSIDSVGILFNDLSRDLAASMGEETGPALFAETWGVAVKATSKLGLFGAWCFKVFFGFVSMLIYIVMYGLKFLLMDVLHPIRFCIALFSGFIAIPLGVWPQLGTLGIWLRQLAQISLWPVIFQLLLTLCASSFRSIFQEVKKIDIAASVTSFFGEGQEPDGSLLLLFKFLMLCCGYIYMTGQVPRLAASIMSSQAVDSLGGMMAAQAASLSSKVGNWASEGPLSTLAPFIGGGLPESSGSGDGSSGGDGSGGGDSSNLGEVKVASADNQSGGDDGGLNARRHQAPPVGV